MIALLMALFARWKVSERVQRPLAIGTLVVAGLALCGLIFAIAMHAHDKHVLEAHEAKQAAQVTQAELNAERTAEANDAVRREQRQADTQDLNAAREAAERSNPDETAKSAGPATRAVLDRLRRQAARNQHPAR